MIRGAARAARGRARRARFAAWAARLRVELARNGGRLILDAPYGAAFDDPPLIKASHHGPHPGAGTLTLSLGRDVDLGRHTVLEVWGGGRSTLEIGDGAELGQGARLTLRDGVIRVGSHVQIRDGVVLKSDGELRIGEWVRLGYGAVVAATQEITIDDFAGTGERASIVDSDHGADGSDAHWMHQPLRVTPVRIGRNVLLGANAVVLRGTRLGPNAVVAAGAVVHGGDLDGGWLYGGVPARALKRLEG